MAGTGEDHGKRIVLVMPYGIENRGVRYIASFLRRGGFTPHLVFIERWVNNRIKPPSEKDEELLAELVAELDPLMVGLSVGAPYYHVCIGLTKRIKMVSGKVPVVWGGVFPTVQPERCVTHADYVCIGEGEQPMLELARALETGVDPRGIMGMWSIRHSEDGEIETVRNPTRPLLRDLDSLPFPLYMDENTWFIEKGRMERRDPIAETVEYRIYPTRGCPYSCRYCQNGALRAILAGDNGPFYRRRSVSSVMEELEYAGTVLPRIRRVKFDGDVFAFPSEWIREFSDQYRRRIGIPFELLTYPGELDLEDLKTMKKAGLLKIQTGIQAGSERVLTENYGRRSTADGIRELSRNAHKAGVEVVYDLIFDNPFATREDRRELIELLLSLERPFKLYLYSLTLFPGTPLTEELLEQGIITSDQVEGDAEKSFRQFRLSFDYPRSREEEFWISLAILSSKSFFPKTLVSLFMETEFFRRHPWPLKTLASLSDFIRVVRIAAGMAITGELTGFKMKQYGFGGKLISQ